MRKRNELKRKTLQSLADGRSSDVPHLAVRVGYYPIRGFYPSLAKWCRWGLLAVSRGFDGRLLYRITDRGRRRLTWLREHFQ